MRKLRAVIGKSLSSVRSEHEQVSQDEDSDYTGERKPPRPSSPPKWQLRLPVASLSAEQVVELSQTVRDWQTCHGSLLRFIQDERGELSTSGTGVTYPVGVTLHPSPFSPGLFHEACALSELFNKLYVAISEDYEWLRDTLADAVSSDALVAVLWKVYERTRDFSLNSDQQKDQQPLCMGIFRSDYMLHDPSSDGQMQLKQVEFNTIACAGAVHGNRVADLHRYLDTIGLYQGKGANTTATQLNIPANDTKDKIICMLHTAHSRYGKPKSTEAIKTCVLFIVQPRNFNISDERPLEYGLQSCNPPVSVFRLEWDDILPRTKLTDAQILLYHNPLRDECYEVSVIFYRAGFEAHEFGGKETETPGFHSRLRLEISRAIKCPPIAAHLVTFKKIQQALCVPGVVERFLSADEAGKVRKTFMAMYPLDDSPEGIEGQRIVMSDSVREYVLKPNREGGGHNIYRESIRKFLQLLDKNKWKDYVLMKLIEPPGSSNIVMNTMGVRRTQTVSELGVWGGCLWRSTTARTQPSLKVVLDEKLIGWSVRTKARDTDEMSVVKGYGYFDSVALLEDVAH